MRVFPAFIPLQGAKIVVVGDGDGAEAKARLAAGSIAELVRVPAARALEPAAYRGARLAFIALSDAARAEAAAKVAREAGALVNVVDRPRLSDFQTPAIVDRSPIVAAIGGGGAAPVLSRLLRGQIEAAWPERLGALAALAAELQDQVRAALPDLPARRAYWRRVLTGAAARAVYAGDTDAGRRIALDELEARTPGRALQLDPPAEAELLTLAAVRALGAADRIVAFGEAGPALAYARRDAARTASAGADQIAAWVSAGELVLLIRPGAELLAALQDLGVEVEPLPVAAA